MTTGPTALAPADLLLRQVRPVGLPGSELVEPADVRIRAGQIAEIGPALSRRASDAVVVDAAGRWLIPGLWDAHVHIGQWADSTHRLDVANTDHPSQVVALVARELAATPESTAPIWGQGFRSAPWPVQPTVAELDAVSGDRPVVLISGDAHNGWLNSAALRRLGLTRAAPLEENAWFAALPELQRLLGSGPADTFAIERVVRHAHARGVVGVVDFEFAANHLLWRERYRAGIDTLRVRAATYPDGLQTVIEMGLRSGDPLINNSDLITMGPLKIISDGSLNTRTAFCCEPYANAGDLAAPFGTQNVAPDDLVALLGTARDHGLAAAVHAIGDAAVRDVLDAFAATGAVGSIEHAQLVQTRDVSRMAALGITASVQPAHLLDDRDVTHQLWSDRADRCFPLRSMIDAGVRLALGSDAPVAPLDPWLAMAAAVHRSGDERAPWNAAESLTAQEALLASVDGRRIAVGEPGDLALLEQDPLRPFTSTHETADHLRAMSVSATVVAGRVVHEA